MFCAGVFGPKAAIDDGQKMRSGLGLFAGSRQQRGQLVDLGKAFVGHQCGQTGAIEHVELRVTRRLVDIGSANVGGDHVVRAVLLRQCADQFTADLPVGADDEDAFHILFVQCLLLNF